MRISVMPFSFARDYAGGAITLPGFFAACAELGADGVGISDGTWPPIGRGGVSELLTQHGLDFAAASSSKDFVTEDEKEFREAAQQVQEEIDRAKRLGASKCHAKHRSPKEGRVSMMTEPGRADRRRLWVLWA